MTGPVGIGIIGCGQISETYFANLATYPGVRVVQVADLDVERARAAAAKHGTTAASGIDELLANDAVELVLNLTIPIAHAEVSLQAIAAGRSVYSEKPLAVSRDEGRQVLDAAAAAGVRVGAAPDTFYGPAGQTARRLVDDGAIGESVGGAAFMLCRGHESWHPAPAFYYKRGAGPLFDMGPYYLTALVNLLGPVRDVQATTAITFAQRTITSEPLKGTSIDVDVPTHVTAILGFASGASVSLTVSFDVWAAQAPPIQLWGTGGSLLVPDPNSFAGQVGVWTPGSGEWRTEGDAGWLDLRGIGVADMARALRGGEPARAGGALSFHVLDVMQSITEAAEQGRRVAVASTCDIPRPLTAADAVELTGRTFTGLRETYEGVHAR